MLIALNGRFSYKVYFFLLLVICYGFKSYDGYDKFLDKNIFSEPEKISNFTCSLFTAIFDRNFYIFSIIFYLIEKNRIKSTKIIKNESSLHKYKRNDYSFIKNENNSNYIKSIFLIFICFLISLTLYTIKVNNSHFKLYFT